jgi:uncharacterized SAM-binding protein YcdF (DUF218 family)
MDLLSNLVLPSVMTYLLFGLGVLAGAFKSTRANSWWLLVTSGGSAILFSSGMVAAALMSPLEYSNPLLEAPDQHPDAKHIVVLTAWASDDQNLPLSARLNASSLYRVVYAFELHRARPDCDVVVSGSATTARLMADVLRQLGVPDDQITVDGDSNSTAESAMMIKTLLADEPFFLVTSAGHIPRALALLQSQGLRAIPAPTDYQLPKEWRFAEVKPTPYSFTVADLAVHEHLAMLWYRLRDML